MDGSLPGSSIHGIFQARVMEWGAIAFSLVLLLTGKYNFLFPLFTRSIYYTSFLLDCFDFAHGYIYVGVYSIILIIIWLIL